MSKTTFFRSLTPALAAGILLTGFSALPICTLAQSPPTEAKSDTKKLPDKRVTLQVEEVSLAVALKLLMKNAEVDFSVAPALNDARVTVHLTNVRLQVALDTLMKVSSIPVEYRVEPSGIYLFEPRKDPPPSEPPTRTEEPKDGPAAPRYETIRLKNADPSYIAWLLGGQPFQVLGQNYGAFGGDFSGSKTFSNGPFGGGGSAQFGLGGNGSNNRRSSTNDQRGLNNILNLLLGGGGGRRR
jgi:hypothetical protein